MAAPAGQSGLIYDTNFWLAISFVIFCIVIVKAAGKTIIGTLDSRSDKIRTTIAEAETLRTEAQQLLAQYQRKQRDAQKETDAMIEKAKMHAYQITKNAEKELKDHIAMKESQLQDQVARMKDQAMAEMKAHAAHLSAAATADIIQDTMNKKTANTLIDGSIKQIKDIAS